MDNPTYCPVCSHKLEIQEKAGRLRPVCLKCGYIHYVNPVPTVGAVIEMDGGIVMIKRKNPPHQGRWAFPSGYVEADERLEEAVVREVEEETGLIVELIELADVNSYPEGPPSSGIMIFYFARPVGGVLRAGDDAEEVRIFPPDDIPRLPFRTHREVLTQWLLRHRVPQNLPSHDDDETQAYLIRAATSADAQQVIELIRMIPANFALDDSAWEYALMRLQELDALYVYVAYFTADPRTIVGCVAMSTTRTITGGYGFINDMAVLPTFRRRGIGAALLEAVMRCAIDLNLSSLIINTERADAQTHKFYLHAGFSDVNLLHLKL